MKKNLHFLFLLFLFLIILCIPPIESASNSNVILIKIDGTIDSSTVELLKEGIQYAKNEKSEAIFILLDTPGGGLDETFEIIKLINQSNIPVVGYVYPQGVSAWSAGTFILMGTHIAAMADHTSIGSCQPVEIGPEGTSYVEDSKVINALVGWLENRAEMHDRNKTIVADFVTENLNLNASLAKKYEVVEFTSPSINKLLQKINGTVVDTREGKVVLDTKNAQKKFYSPSFKTQFLKIISNPLLTSLLFMLGVFALIFGISAPGYGAEVFGVIAILLSLVGSGFSIPYLSIIFIIIGALLLIIEILVIPGFGIVGIGGIISLFIGSIFLIPSYSSYSTRKWMIGMDWINNALLVLIAVVVLAAMFFGFLLYKIIEIRKKKKAVGVFIGETATTIDLISPENPGYVRFKGEYWQARSNNGTIKENTKVEIVDKEDSTLVVRPK